MDIFTLDISIVPRVRLIGHVSYKEPWIHFSRTANEYIGFFIKNGELYIREDDVEYSLRRNDFLLLEPNKPHVGFKAAKCHYFFIHFKHQDIKKIPVSDEYLTHTAILNRKQSLTSDCFSDMNPGTTTCFLPKHYNMKNSNEIFEILNLANDDFYNSYEYYKNIVSMKLAEILIKLSREYISTSIIALNPHYSKSLAKASNIINYLNNNYARKITSTDIENIFESNYDYLNRIFQKTTGKSIFNYVNEIRISKAKELIMTTPLKFSEIAYLVGIDDQYYFSKLFKKITGITPTQFYNDKSKNI